MGECRSNSTILNLGTRWLCGQLHPLTPSFTTGERVDRTDWIGGWVGLKAGLGGMEKIKILPLPGINTTICENIPITLH
jgi:hypothetical protein